MVIYTVRMLELSFSHIVIVELILKLMEFDNPRLNHTYPSGKACFTISLSKKRTRGKHTTSNDTFIFFYKGTIFLLMSSFITVHKYLYLI
uniref:Uncharacterized protein n=1 Tax=Strigamia maritima TaxID=126957 RepID=T1JLE4_STRMM